MDTLNRKRVIEFLGGKYHIRRHGGVPVLTPDHIVNPDPTRAPCPDCGDNGYFHDGKYTRLCGLCKVTIEVRRVHFATRYDSPRDLYGGISRKVFSPVGGGRYFRTYGYSQENIVKAVAAVKEASAEARQKGEKIEFCVVVL